jgi:hypothetical protein
VIPCRFCGAPSVGRYLLGWACPNHTAAALAGRPEPPDPARTLPAEVPRVRWRTYGPQRVGPGDVSRFRDPEG